MIDIDFSLPIDQVRANIGDIGLDFVSDSTIQSALNVNNGDIPKASLLVAKTLLAAFATMADREREGQVEVYYTKLYERYKDLVNEQEDDIAVANGAIPIIIGGTSIERRNQVLEDLDVFTTWDIPAWEDIMFQLQRKFSVA